MRVICERCGATDLAKSDLCGNAGCVYCCGTPIRNGNKCISCGEETEEKLFNEDLCPKCYEKAQAMSFMNREKFMYDIFLEQVKQSKVNQRSI